MKTKYKYIVTIKTARGYDCHLPLGTYVGYFFTIGDHWFFHDEHSWGDSDRSAARTISKRWAEIAHFLGQLNKEKNPKEKCPAEAGTQTVPPGGNSSHREE